jgi:1-acyl-sn-glycerol-3-phosphate acyltransferase
LIIVANHCSYLDPPLVAVAYRQRRVRFIAKVELWRGGFMNWYLTSIGTIPVERGGGGRDAIEEAIECVKQGACLGIFPEGTRSTTGEIGRGRSGFLVIAARTKAPLLPVLIEGTFESLPTGAKKPKAHPIVAYTGEPFELTDEQCDLTDRRRMHDTVEMVMSRIAGARKKYVNAGE